MLLEQTQMMDYLVYLQLNAPSSEENQRFKKNLSPDQTIFKILPVIGGRKKQLVRMMRKRNSKETIAPPLRSPYWSLKRRQH